MKESEIIASRYHGGLAVAHFIAALYNMRNKRWGHSAVHLTFVLYDGWSAYSHRLDADERYESYCDR